MRKIINIESLTKTLNIKVKNIKSMTWDELSNWMQVVAALVGMVTFLALIVTVWVTLKASAEKDAKARDQEERIKQISLKVEEEARKRAEAERALLEVQERLRHRRLTNTQKANLQKHLEGKPKGTIEIMSDNNTEANEYAKDWASVFQKSGWTVTEITAVVPLDLKSNFNVAVEVRGDNPPTIALYQAVKAEGIDLEFFKNTERKNDELLMIIGTKR